jgi:hypothetical protein
MSEDGNHTVRWFTCIVPQSGCWSNQTLDDVVATPGSGMTLLPTAVKYLNAAGFIYATANGMLSTYIETTNDTAVDGWAWTPGSLGVRVPSNSSIGAFVYARSQNLINTYVLYQETNNDIYVVWQDDASGWRGPTSYPALAGADPGTDIVCLTMQAWDASGVDLSALTDMNRCYFQAGARLKEVWFDGATWHDQGFVPMS